MAKEFWTQVIDSTYGPLPYDVSPNGKIRDRENNKILDSYKDKDGYITIYLLTPDGRKKFYIHRLVATAFIANPDNKPYVNHIDGNKHNPVASNLEWVTPKENTSHAIRIGLQTDQIGENNNAAKYTNDDIRNVCKLLEDGLMSIDISRITNIPTGTIAMIKNGLEWKEISKDYNIHRQARNKFDNVFSDIVTELIRGKFSTAEISKIYGVPEYHVRNIVTKRRHKHQLEGITFHPRYFENLKKPDYRKLHDMMIELVRHHWSPVRITETCYKASGLPKEKFFILAKYAEAKFYKDRKDGKIQDRYPKEKKDVGFDPVKRTKEIFKEIYKKSK